MKTLDIQSNFLALEEEHSTLENARIAIVQAPYEHTVSYGTGTGKGPQAILTASHFVEFWDEEFGRELCFDHGIATLEAIDFAGAADRAALDLIEQQVRSLLEMDKFVVTLGGEHTIAAAVTPASAVLSRRTTGDNDRQRRQQTQRSHRKNGSQHRTCSLQVVGSLRRVA